VNLMLTITALSLLQATLTLPGIAGLLLSVGMSVDANILINERIREELKNGKPPFSAMEAGFSKAWSTIIDSNLTTLIKMAILYVFGAGVVRGFAVTIFLGIMISMFTATLLVRMMMTLWMRRTRPKQLKISLVRFVPDKTKVERSYVVSSRTGAPDDLTLSVDHAVNFSRLHRSSDPRDLGLALHRILWKAVD